MVEMKRNRIRNILLVFISAISILASGCGEGQATTEKSEDVKTESASTQSTSDETESTAETDESSSETKETEEPKEPFVSDRSAAFELLSNIKIGWNLGNTLDAHGAGNNLSAETYWGNPKTSQEMIDAIAAQGFNAIRIPVTFAEHVGKAPDYVINEKWLDRVQEVVDYAVNDGLYVMIDTHHEPDFWMIPDTDHEEKNIAELTAIWKQVAERFKDYDEKLIFEGMNEPRVKGSAGEWSGGDDMSRKVVDHMNQAFVDAVRSTGGNNATRLLVICPYGNNPTYNAIKDMAIPEDNYIAVAIHMYTPYYFTFAGTDSSFYDTWDGSEKGSIANTLKQVKNYLTNKDVPVVVTEFGAVNKGNSEEIIKWAADYLGIMNKYDIRCFWWDNGCYNTNGENFGLLNRKELTWYDQALADALIKQASREE